MTNEGWLTKAEVNALYYSTVAGAVAFVTEAQASLHVDAVARLLARHAKTLGRRELRILEIGANDAAFARTLLARLRSLSERDPAGLTRIDYVAVEFARGSLEAAARFEEQRGESRVRRPGQPAAVASGLPARPELIALVSKTTGRLTTHLGLVHAEANQFVAASGERFDVAILNELLDDLPSRAFYADAVGRRYELVAHAAYEGALWRVRVRAEPLADGELAELPPATLTARSTESVELVQGIARLLSPGGMLLVHDYGFANPFPRLAPYEGLPGSVPPSAELDFPPGSEQGFPRAFYRVFGNEDHRVVQITTDVNFAELVAALEPSGQVITLAHGNAIANRPGFTGFDREDGVFLSAFGLLEPHDDLPALLGELEREQERLRAAYVRDHMGGNENVYSDLVYVKR